jgi:hypothetical protein
MYTRILNKKFCICLRKFIPFIYPFQKFKKNEKAIMPRRHIIKDI